MNEGEAALADLSLMPKYYDVKYLELKRSLFMLFAMHSSSRDVKGFKKDVEQSDFLLPSPTYPSSLDM